MPLEGSEGPPRVPTTAAVARISPAARERRTTRRERRRRNVRGATAGATSSTSSPPTASRGRRSSWRSPTRASRRSTGSGSQLAPRESPARHRRCRAPRPCTRRACAARAMPTPSRPPRHAKACRRASSPRSSTSRAPCGRTTGSSRLPSPRAPRDGERAREHRRRTAPPRRRARGPRSPIGCASARAYLEDTFYPEVRGLFTMAERLEIDPLAMQGSGSGAFGFPQFLPTSYLRYGADGDGDGRVSLYDMGDAAASCARFSRRTAGARPRSPSNAACSGNTTAPTPTSTRSSPCTARSTPAASRNETRASLKAVPRRRRTRRGTPALTRLPPRAASAEQQVRARADGAPAVLGADATACGRHVRPLHAPRSRQRGEPQAATHSTGPAESCMPFFFFFFFFYSRSKSAHALTERHACATRHV